MTWFCPEPRWAAGYGAAQTRSCPQGFTLSFRVQDGYTIAAIVGELDIACAPALREHILGVLGSHASRIVIDLSGVTFCDATGLAVLVGASLDEPEVPLDAGLSRLDEPDFDGQDAGGLPSRINADFRTATSTPAALDETLLATWGFNGLGPLPGALPGPV